MVGFLLKIFGVSILLSIAIKYGGPWLPVSDSTTTALIAIGLPSVLLGLMFSWRWQQSR